MRPTVDLLFGYRRDAHLRLMRAHTTCKHQQHTTGEKADILIVTEVSDCGLSDLVVTGHPVLEHR
jgi:uncharacterized protein YcbK (DUF882 family)